MGSPHEQCSAGLPGEGPFYLHSASGDKVGKEVTISQAAHAQHMLNTCSAHALQHTANMLSRAEVAGYSVIYSRAGYVPSNCATCSIIHSSRYAVSMFANTVTCPLQIYLSKTHHFSLPHLLLLLLLLPFLLFFNSQLSLSTPMYPLSPPPSPLRPSLHPSFPRSSSSQISPCDVTATSYTPEPQRPPFSSDTSPPAQPPVGRRNYKTELHNSLSKSCYTYVLG